jgi:hypothetical protein
MNVIVIDSAAFEELKTSIEKHIEQGIQNGLKSILTPSRGKEWITLAEARKLLPYRSKTKWQELRDKGEVVFSQFGRKIMYDKESLLLYLSKNKKDTF